MSRTDVIQILYIVAFSMFIIGLHMLRGPRTAVRGNQVAAVGMAIAVGATLAQEGVGDWALIVLGGLLVIGHAEGFLNELLLVIAIIFGTINVVGGFLVTDRMLGMFKGKKKQEAAAPPAHPDHPTS